MFCAEFVFYCVAYYFFKGLFDRDHLDEPTTTAQLTKTILRISPYTLVCVCI